MTVSRVQVEPEITITMTADEARQLMYAGELVGGPTANSMNHQLYMSATKEELLKIRDTLREVGSVLDTLGLDLD